MSKKKTTSANRGGPKTPARKKPGHVERVSKARTAAGARQALLEMLGDEELSLAKLGLQLAEAATERREALSTLGGNLGRSGYILAGLAGEGDQLVRRMARQVLLHRQQVIGELELDTAAEFMLLDAAMDAYLHWLHLTLLLRVGTCALDQVVQEWTPARGKPIADSAALHAQAAAITAGLPSSNPTYGKTASQLLHITDHCPIRVIPAERAGPSAVYARLRRAMARRARAGIQYSRARRIFAGR